MSPTPTRDRASSTTRRRPEPASDAAAAKEARGGVGNRVLHRLNPRRWSPKAKRRLLLTGIGALVLFAVMTAAVSLDYSSRIHHLWGDDSTLTTGAQYQSKTRTQMPWAVEVISPDNPVLADLVSAYETTQPQWRDACRSMLADIHLPWLLSKKKAACTPAAVRTHVEHMALDTYAYAILAARQLCTEVQANRTSKSAGKPVGKTTPGAASDSASSGASSIAWDQMRAFFEAPGLQPGDVMTRIDADIAALSAQIQIAAQAMPKTQTCVADLTQGASGSPTTPSPSAAPSETAPSGADPLQP
jgi:hypothetical protein